MEKSEILVVDDEEIICELLSRTLKKEGYRVEAVKDGNDALEKVKKSFFNLLITDLKMPKVDGMNVLEEIKKVNPHIEVIIITGYPSIESATEAMKKGAFDFICKPFDVQEVGLAVKRCLEKQKFMVNHIEFSELKKIFEISETIASNVSLDSLFQRILDSALGIVKAKRGSLLLFDEKTKEIKIKAASGLSGEVIKNTEVKLDAGIFKRVIEEGKPLLVNDIELDPRFQRNNKSQYETRTFLSIPLKSRALYSQGNVLGMVNIADKVSGEEFTEREQILLSVLAGQAASAIENYKLYSQLQDKIKALKDTINKLNETQNHLIQSEKMVAVGELASGIAHEIRNPLGIILGGVEFLKNNLGNGDTDTKESIEKIKSSISRANNIVIDLLRFSRASELQLKPVNVCELIDEVVSLIKNQAYLKNVQINRNYTEKNFYIEADISILRQAFFNLCINAMDAMPQGGELTLSLHSGREKGQNERDVVIEIADTGKGIPEEILPKIFDPFFTTKKSEKGTGLGLSIVCLILERHKGAISVESKVNKGTKFIITLPAKES